MDMRTALDGNLAQRWLDVSHEVKHNITTSVSAFIVKVNYANKYLQALAAYPYLHRFTKNWAAEEIMRRTLKNGRDPRARQKGGKRRGRRSNGKHNRQPLC
jgi:hypothetical protein